MNQSAQMLFGLPSQMFGLPLREVIFWFFGTWALASLFMIVYAVRVKRGPLREALSVLVPIAASLVLDACILTKTFSQDIVCALNIILLAVVFRNWLPMLKRVEPERRLRRDKIKAQLRDIRRH